jgi:hypothetical protein
MPKIERSEREERIRVLLMVGPAVREALDWILDEDMRQALENQKPPCTPDEGRFWAGVGSHCLELLKEVNETAQARLDELEEERSES